MKKFSKVMFAAAVVLVMLCTAVFAAPSAVMTNDTAGEAPVSEDSATLFAESGVCGDHLTWTLDADGTLTISGEGNMYDWSAHSNPFNQSTKIKKVVVKEGVKNISDRTFLNCTSIESVELPDGLTTIEGSAFHNCASLKKVTFGDGLVSIGQRAFSYCPLIESIDLPDTVKTIGESAFDECDSLKTANIGTGVTNLGDYAFSRCDALESIVLPDGVTSIGQGTFMWCKKLKSVTLGKDVMSIGDYAFSIAGLESLVMPDSLRFIGEGSFSSCENLKDLTLSKNLKSLGESAFEGCYSIESLELPDTLESLATNAFRCCFALKSVTFGANFKSIGTCAFENCVSLINVVIPDSVFYVGDEAFSGCTALKSATIGSGITSIRKGMFGYCLNLESIVIPDSVQTIGDNAFITCEELKSVTFGNGLTSIGEEAFANCITLNNVVIPDSVTTIAGSAFRWCEDMTDITIGNNVKYIGDEAFDYCVSLESVVIPDSVTTIGTSAFSRCKCLTDITIGKGVTSIGANAFSDCKKITIHGYPNSVASTYATENRIPFVALEEAGFVVTYDACGGVNAPEMQTKEKGKALTLSKQIPTRPGSEFAGWSDTYRGDVKYKPGAKYTADESVTLYAVWDPIKVKENSTIKATIENGVVDATNLYVKVENERDLTITISGIDVCDYYHTNQTTTPKDNFEFIWEVGIISDEPTWFSVLTANWAFEPGREELTAIKDMQHSVSLDNKNGGKVIGNANMSYTEDSITWKFSIPDEYHFDFDETIQFVVKVRDIYGTDIKRTYNIGSVVLADAVKITPLKSTSLAVGKNVTIKAKAYCTDGRKPESTGVSFSIIEGEDCATIDEKGKLIGCATGEVVVRVKALYGRATAYEDIIINVCIPATKVTLNKTSASMIVGDNLQLLAVKAPENNTDTVTWTSDKPDIASVDEWGFVTAHKAGKAKITAMTGSGKKATCTVTVGLEADKVEFTALKSTSLALGKTLTLKAKASREDKAKPVSTDVVYKIIDGEECATIDAKGKLSAIALGQVTVRAKAAAGDAYADITITVCIPATKVSLSTTKASMVVGGEDLQLVATMTPAENTDTLTWSSDKPEIASVDQNGVVTAHNAGKAKITATAGSGKKATCTVTVGVAADTVTFSSLKSTSLAVGKTLSLSAKASRADKVKPVSTNVVYEIVSGSEFATIDSKGKLKGIATGVVVVRATAEAGTETAFAEVTINVCIPATKVVLNMTKAEVETGKKLYLTATLSPENHTDTLTWSCDKPEIASVDQNGVVTGIKEGSAKVTAMSGSGKKATCTVKVVKPEYPDYFVELDAVIDSYEFEPGEGMAAVGYMRIKGTVTGPSEVKSVLIASWNENMANKSIKELYAIAEINAKYWKEDDVVDPNRRLPIEINQAHPVYEKDLGKNFQVLLVGLDKDCNPIGYYIVNK